VVLTKSANVGDNITPFSSAADTKGAVVTIADMETLEVEADVAESSLGKVKVGQPCEIQLDALSERRFAGVVQRIVPTVDRAKATVLVKIRFVERDPRLVPDMAAKVAFLERELAADEKQPVPAVPRSALVERDGAKYVFVVKDGRARRVRADGARSLGESVQVDGVALGERVIVKPLERLADGTLVK
jgi:RND family efflux transporter MFP subunit